jgi:AGZA family xanthine/uracil permease-like MFS transporter
VKWDDLTEAVPAFITAVMMPFSFSITEGIALGFISYCVMKIGTGRLRDLSPCVNYRLAAVRAEDCLY